MGFLNDLLGGERRGQFEDLLNRFQGGDHASISDQEAADRYREVEPNLSDDDYEASAADAFQKLTPEQRRQFGAWLRQQSGQGGTSGPSAASALGGQAMSSGEMAGLGMENPTGTGASEGDLEDPGQLARYTSQVRRSNPSVFEQVLGRGGTGGAFDNPIAKMAVAGIAAMAAQRIMGGRR